MKYRRLLKYALRQWPSLALIVVLTFISSAGAILQPWPLKILVDYALGNGNPSPFLKSFVVGWSGSNTTDLIIAAGLMSLVVFVLNTILEIGLTLAWSVYGDRVVYDLAADLFHRLQRVSLLHHYRRSVGDSLSRLSWDVYCIYGLVQTFLSPVQNVLTLVTLGIVAWSLDPALTGSVLVIAPLQVASSRFFAPRLKRRAQQNRKVESSLFAFVHQTLTSIPLVQAFGTEERNGRQFRRMAADAVELSQRGTLIGNAYGIVTGLNTVLFNGLLLYIGGGRVLSGALSAGSLLVFLSYMGSIQSALGALLSRRATIKPLEVKIDRVLEILDLDPVVHDPAGGRPLPARRTPRGHVRIENVTFGYERDRRVLQGVSLEARPGETIAIVGSTGAGKSTLVSLIPRFYDPWDGRVTIDGFDIRKVQLASLRAEVALVLQEPYLLPITPAQNIAYGRPDATREEIVAAAVAANADEFIRRLPEGYDTVIGERGATLSGGERQRIAIARALLKDAPILVLDEPTSALDANTETLLLQALRRLMVGRTTFIIAHRLSTIRDANRIVVIDHGRIVESGSHDELIETRGHYHRFHSLQFGEIASSQVSQ